MMKNFFGIFIAAAALFDGTLAHYRFTKLIANGVTTGEYEYVRINTNMNSPVYVGSEDLRCNTGGSTSGTSTSTYTVAAGSTVGFETDQAIFHKGPLLVYMSKVSDAKTADGSSGWFKIYEIPPTFSGGEMLWPTDGQSKFTFALPSSISAGQYLLRIEHIALHSMPAQFYVSCAQLQVTGGGSASPATISFPSVYSATDPGININIYYPVPTSYVMPGPAVFSG